MTRPTPLPEELEAALSDLPDRTRGVVVALRAYLMNPALRGSSEVRAALARNFAALVERADEVVQDLFAALGGRRALFALLLDDLECLQMSEPADSDLRSPAVEAKAALEAASVGLARGKQTTSEVPAVTPAKVEVPPDPEAIARAVLLDAAPVALPRLTDEAVAMAVHNLLRRQRLVALVVGTPKADVLKVQLIKGVAAGGTLKERLRRLPARVEFARRHWGLVALTGERWPRVAETLAEPLDAWPDGLCGVVVLVPVPCDAGRPLPTGNLAGPLADRARGRFFGVTPLERYMAEVVRLSGKSSRR